MERKEAQRVKYLKRDRSWGKMSREKAESKSNRQKLREERE